MSIKPFLPFAIIAAIACGSVEDQRLSETTDEDFVEVCEDNRDLFLGGDVEAAVRLSCVLDLDADGSCTEATLAECVAQTPTFQDEEVTLSCENIDLSPLRECDATVGDMLDCLDEYLQQLEGFADVSCGEATTADLIPPNSCFDFYRACPGFVEVDSGTSS